MTTWENHGMVSDENHASVRKKEGEMDLGGQIKAHYRLVMLFLFNREGNGGSGRLSNFTWS